MFVVTFFRKFVCDEYLTTDCLGSCQVNIHSPLTVQSCARQSNIVTNWTTVHGVYSVLIPKDLVDSSLIG
jgi:hypothetical protein